LNLTEVSRTSHPPPPPPPTHEKWWLLGGGGGGREPHAKALHAMKHDISIRQGKPRGPVPEGKVASMFEVTLITESANHKRYRVSLRSSSKRVPSNPSPNGVRFCAGRNRGATPGSPSGVFNFAGKDGSSPSGTRKKTRLKGLAPHKGGLLLYMSTLLVSTSARRFTSADLPVSTSKERSPSWCSAKNGTRDPRLGGS